SFVFPRNGEQLGIICEDNKYDFTLQEIRDMKEIVIVKPGDEILVECNFQTLGRPGTTFVSLFFYLQIFHCF
ncbi:MOXD2 protein, partial [Thalassarche chlororhynchos]|nr:MOXD2 protein [Thalassarche chlororhynchos]